MRSHLRTTVLPAAVMLIFTCSAHGASQRIPPNCFQLSLPKQSASTVSVLGVGVSQSKNEPGKALNEVELSLTRPSADNTIMSLSAIRDVHFLLSDETVYKLLALLDEVRELDKRLTRQGRDEYNEPLMEVPLVDKNGKRQTLVLGVSRILKWNCYSKGEWTSLPGAAQTFLVLRMPFALEYSREHDFTGLQFDFSAVAKLTRILRNLLEARQAGSENRT